MDETKTVREILFDFDTTVHREREVELNIAINKLRISPYLDQIVSSLSGGEKKRVALTKVLMGNPEMLILDEPTNHLDLESINTIEQALQIYQGALLVISHDKTFCKNVGCGDFYL